jgi:hypothetical protein
MIMLVFCVYVYLLDLSPKYERKYAYCSLFHFLENKTLSRCGLFPLVFHCLEHYSPNGVCRTGSSPPSQRGLVSPLQIRRAFSRP